MSVTKRIFQFFAIAAIALVVFVAILILNNNFSLRSTSRAQFVSELDRSIEQSTVWMSNHPELMGNVPLMFMVGDMARMSSDPRLRDIVAKFAESRRSKEPDRVITAYYICLAEGTTDVPALTIPDMDGLNWQDIVDAYAVAPHKVDLPVVYRDTLFSPTRFIWGKRYHQLIALDVYRYFNGTSPQLDAVINPVTEAVANDSRFDFRVNDSYSQRLWIIFGAGRPDLVRRRWVERLIGYQRSDGSWSYCWYGWCKGIVEFRLGDFGPDHSTVQAAYALYLIKYRYPQWINEHFH
jgi:hypothetical protein